MKKILTVLLVFVLVLTILTGCNKQLFDTTYSFDRAIITLPNGEIIEGKIDSWTDYEDGDQIQVKINGTTYLVHSSNIVLIAE
jgi:ribosomal protein S1